MKPLERDLEKQVREYAESRGVLCYKFVSPGHRGVPDRLLISATGKVLFLELKRIGKNLNALQLREHRLLRARHVPVFTADSVSVACRIIDELLT